MMVDFHYSLCPLAFLTLIAQYLLAMCRYQTQSRLSEALKDCQKLLD
jgi:hypothetical protein